MLTFALGPKDVRVHVDDMASNMDYFCPTCGSPVIPRKGEVRRHHFAHKGGGSCADGWSRSYDDSEWHHPWQERFPKENQEVTLTLGQIRHRADVLAGPTVVEFQRSTLTPEQFNDRNTFYQDLGYKVVWLYDLRDTFREGGMRKEPREDGGLLFSWDNSRKAFRAYDLEHGNVDLFLQLREEDDGTCIIRPEDVSTTGFESFGAQPDVAGRITFCTINKLAKDIYEDSCQRHGAAPRRVDPKAVRAILLDACRRARKGYVSEGDLVDLESAISYVKNMMLLDDARAIADIADSIKRFDEILALYQDGLTSCRLMSSQRVLI